MNSYHSKPQNFNLVLYNYLKDLMGPAGALLAPVGIILTLIYDFSQNIILGFRNIVAQGAA